MVRDWKTIDYFTDQSVVADPYPYFDALREACPYCRYLTSAWWP